MPSSALIIMYIKFSVPISNASDCNPFPNLLGQSWLGAKELGEGIQSNSMFE